MHTGCGFSVKGGREVVGVVFTTEDRVLILAVDEASVGQLSISELDSSGESF